MNGFVDDLGNIIPFIPAPTGSKNKRSPSGI